MVSFEMVVRNEFSNRIPQLEFFPVVLLFLGQKNK